MRIANETSTDPIRSDDTRSAPGESPNHDSTSPIAHVLMELRPAPITSATPKITAATKSRAFRSTYDRRS